MTDELLTAQAYILFTAGSDSTALVISNAFYELANNLEIQKTLRSEINDMNDELNYESIQKMTYLDKVFKGENFFIFF